MTAGIGDGNTRGDHRGLADQISAFLGRGDELRRLIAIVAGRRSLTTTGACSRSSKSPSSTSSARATNDARSSRRSTSPAWELLGRLPASELKRIPPRFVERHHEPSGSAPVASQ
jgi:V/A-type H+-transporting ATPase subunit B